VAHVDDIDQARAQEIILLGRAFLRLYDSTRICRVSEENLSNLANQSHKISLKTVPFQTVVDYSERTH
jgi:hypothetical protein